MHYATRDDVKIDRTCFILGNSLSASGYHLCLYNETRNVSFLVMHTVPYKVTKPCGDWLLSRTCTLTLYRMTHQTEYKTVMEQRTRCCDGYEQVGRYCALRECSAQHTPAEIIEERKNCSVCSYMSLQKCL